MWLNSKTDNEREDIIDYARTQRKLVSEKEAANRNKLFEERCAIVEEKIKEKKEFEERKEKKKLDVLKHITNIGIWHTNT